MADYRENGSKIPTVRRHVSLSRFQITFHNENLCSWLELFPLEITRSQIYSIYSLIAVTILADIAARNAEIGTNIEKLIYLQVDEDELCLKGPFDAVGPLE